MRRCGGRGRAPRVDCTGGPESGPELLGPREPSREEDFCVNLLKSEIYDFKMS